jgi:hypothetical protein
MKNLGKSGFMNRISGGLSNLPGLGMGGDSGNIMGNGLPIGNMKTRKTLSLSIKKKLKQKRKQAKKARKKGRKK